MIFSIFTTGGGSKSKYTAEVCEFSMEKLKIYLDTNTVIDFFINAVRSIRMKVELRLPKKYQFFAAKVAEIEFLTSVLTKNEIIRELIAGFDLNEAEVLRLWNEFSTTLNCSYIDRIIIDESMTEITLKFRMKLRTLLNLIHLFIAMEQDTYLLTGDKDLSRIVKETNVYDRVLTYPELRKIFT